jgi:hypothetical protein
VDDDTLHESIIIDRDDGWNMVVSCRHLFDRVSPNPAELEISLEEYDKHLARGYETLYSLKPYFEVFERATCDIGAPQGYSKSELICFAAFMPGGFECLCTLITGHTFQYPLYALAYRVFEGNKLRCF